MSDATSSKKTAKGFSSHLGFVLAAAGSAVGVGNLWRFPYLAAKDGGGLFILVYLVLVFTFGYTLLASDIAIGRKTQMNSIRAYAAMRPRWGFLGVVTFVVPLIIMTYYAVIGGWIVRFFVGYLMGEAHSMTQDGFFTRFISNPQEASLYAVLFMALTSFIVFRGVQGGIEKCSKIVMPLLLIGVAGIAIYALTLVHVADDGSVRTGIQGLLVYLTPDVRGLTLHRFLQILLDGMSQLFFSLSVSMGIMITYGAYVKKDVDLNKSIAQIELFDTGVALVAGVMIIPAMYVFAGVEGMQSGPSLMFVSLPRVFLSMGELGVVVGAVFFLMAGFATLTSCISVLETIVANVGELFGTSRTITCMCASAFYTLASVVIALGYSVLYVEVSLPNGAVGQLLDIADYVSNSCMMPAISFLSAILISWVVKTDWIEQEFLIGSSGMHRARIFRVMVRFVVPVVMGVLFLQACGIV